MRLLVWLLRLLFPAGRRRRSRPRWHSLAALVGLGGVMGALALGVMAVSRYLVPSLPAESQGVLVPTPTLSVPLLRPLVVPNPAYIVTEQLYVPVTSPLDLERTGVTLADVQARWRQAAKLVVTEEVAQALSAQWGPPGEGVVVVPDVLALSRQLVDLPDAIGLLPFDELTPAVRALPLDGADPFDRTVSNKLWPLRVTWGVTAGSALVEAARRAVPATNREPDAIGTVVLTGVTILPAGAASTLEGTKAVRGMLLFARSADVWHVNLQGDPPACSASDEAPCTWGALPVLRAFGADVVELTGLPRSAGEASPAIRRAIRLLDEEGLGTFGAGANAAEAARPLIVDVRGTRVAFLGYAVGQYTPAATPNAPGANAFDAVRLRADIIAARLSGADLVFVLLHYGETFLPTPSEDQREHFRVTAEAGANLVVGTQPFAPQVFELYQGVPVAYGLGPFMVPSAEQYGQSGLVLQVLVHRGNLLQVRPLGVQAGLQPRLFSAAEMQPFLATLIRPTR